MQGKGLGLTEAGREKAATVAIDQAARRLAKQTTAALAGGREACAMTTYRDGSRVQSSDGGCDSAPTWAQTYWGYMLQFLLVLWVVRVPLSMVALGLLLLGMAPQAQDLFVEFARSPPWHMLLFLVVLIGSWALPTHYAARLLLDTDVRLQGLLTKAKSADQAHCLDASSRHLPRALGLLTFVAVLIAIWRSHSNLPDLDPKEGVIAAVDRSLVEMALLVVAGGAGFIIYVSRRLSLVDLPILRALKRLNSKLVFFWRLISPGLVYGTIDEEARDVGRLILLGIFMIFLLIFAFGADFAAWLFPRAMAVPFILGGWLPFLSYLSGVGRQVRAPLIVGLFALVAVLTFVLGDNHSVRRIDAARAVGQLVDVSPMPLNAAVEMWMKENRCDGAPTTCPRPIIVSAAGGASRAGFFMATIIGYFMQKDEANRRGLDPNQVRNRLFAISAVSGGAVGAVMVTAALDAKADSNDHPCVQSPIALWWGQKINNWRDCFEALTSGDFLTGDFFGFAFNDMLPFGRWRDRAAVLEDTWAERYQAVVTRADAPAAAPACKGLNCPFLTLRPRSGHWIPLLVLNGTSQATGGRIVTTALASTYTPVLTCPTASAPPDCQLFVQADRFHDLLDYKLESDGWSDWFGAFERYLLRNLKGDDIRLSTAAHNSARFPLISPPGSVRNQDQAIVDRILDGGYFENYGALAAKELALAVHAIQPQLAPLVVVISNDPDDLLNPNDDSNTPEAKGQLQEHRKDQVAKARAVVDGSELVTDVVAPVTTIANARTAHGILGVDQLHSALHEAIPTCDDLLVQVRVWPQLEKASNRSKAVSMSWWLSTPIQRHLHQQTEDEKGMSQNRSHLEAIWALMKAKSDCAAMRP